MIILDEALTPQVFTSIQSQIFSNSFPWFFTETSFVSNSNCIHDTSFFHLAVSNSKLNSEYGPLLNLSLISILDKLNYQLSSIHRIRIGLLEPKIIGKYINKPHVDDFQPHMVGLLYLTDSNGETLIYNETYNSDLELDFINYSKQKYSDKFTIKETVESRRNRFVMFDGKHYHSSTCPTDVSRRIVINYNFSINL